MMKLLTPEGGVDIDYNRTLIAKIIFTRMAGQISGFDLSEMHWDIAYKGWIDNPAIFPMVEVCMDAADEILTSLGYEGAQ